MTSKNIKPEFSRNRVNRAGDHVRSDSLTEEDIYIIENWRAAHSKILNDWQATLRGRCKDKDIVFAQRLKRRSTIFDKLKRKPDMQLARMHDIAGCRLIFKNIEELHEYREKLHKAIMKHILRKETENPYPYDYISSPHPDQSGYRGIHDVYQYCARPNRDNSWNDLLIEIQYRTKAQHAWATANEIAGSLTGNYSKFGRGDETQQEFFRLASEIIARNEENMRSCYPGLSNTELVARFNKIEEEIKLLKQLKTIKILQLNSQDIDFNNQNIILMHDETQKKIFVRSFDSLPKARKEYFKLEENYGDSRDIVLVRTPSQDSLRQAYKNYFSDTKDFTRLIMAGIDSLFKSK